MKYLYKKANSFLSILLSVILVLCSTVYPVFAFDMSNENLETYQVTPRYTTISNIQARFSIDGLTATTTATLVSLYSTNLKIVVELQKNKSTGYETIETWTKTGSGTLLSIEESRLINILSDYRVRITYTAGSESTTIYRYPA